VARCDTYDVGECTWGVCHNTAWIPEGLGNANQWGERAAARGFRVSFTLTSGAVVVFRPGGPYSEFGHVGKVIEVYDAHHFLVDEMNYAEWNRYDHRRTDDSWILGFIIPPGVSVGTVDPPPVSRPSTQMAGLQLAWADAQQFWNNDIENAVHSVQFAGGLIVNISRS
jgi:hypothetical protein